MSWRHIAVHWHKVVIAELWVDRQVAAAESLDRTIVPALYIVVELVVGMAIVWGAAEEQQWVLKAGRQTE